jgi:uncharacterized protein YndB with AHSA1/START domain
MSTVVAFDVPPVVKVVRVTCTPAQAFERFTRDIARWWPLRTHSLFKGDAVSVAFEPRAGGRLFERSAGGDEQVWGLVTAWDPPARLGFTWHVGRSPDTAQHVELTFTSCPEGSEVRLVHSGWEALAQRGAPLRDEYERGWSVVFVERYGDFARSEGTR